MMTLLAMRLEEWIDILPERHGFFRESRRRKRNQTTIDRGLDDGWIGARQHGVERVFQVVASRLRTCSAKTLLIVNPSAVTQAALCIKKDDFGGALDPKHLCRRAIAILDEGKLDPEIDCLLRHLGNAVFRSNIDR